MLLTHGSHRTDKAGTIQSLGLRYRSSPGFWGKLILYIAHVFQPWLLRIGSVFEWISSHSSKMAAEAPGATSIIDFQSEKGLFPHRPHKALETSLFALYWYGSVMYQLLINQSVWSGPVIHEGIKLIRVHPLNQVSSLHMNEKLKALLGHRTDAEHNEICPLKSLSLQN